MMVILGGSLGRIQFQTACTVGDTFDPSITLRAGCPYTPAWDFGNGDTATGLSVSYVGYVDAGPHTVTLTIPNIAHWLTGIDVNTDKITGDFLAAIKPCRSLTNIQAYENAAMTGDLANLSGMSGLTTLRLGDHTAVTGDIAALAGLPLVYLRLSGAAVHGDVADIAGLTSLTTLDIHSNLNNGGITGDLADIAGMTSLVYLSFGQTLITGDIGDLSGLTTIQTLFCYNNGSITGNTSDLAAMVNLIYCYTYGTSVIPDTIADKSKIRELRVQDSGLSQAQVDALLAHIYTNRATFASTVSPIILRIEADNAAPGSVYQDGDPPTTGLEYVYELANDPKTEGFKPWAITWNGGSAP